MFGKMKPVPKFLLIVVLVGGVVYGAKLGMSLLPEKKPEVAAVPVTTTPVPAETAQPAPQPAPAPIAAAPQPAPAAPVLQPAPSNDAGLANVLGSTKK